MHNALYETYYRVEANNRYLVQTQSQTKAIGIMLPEVHGARKTLDMNMLPEKQKPQIHGEQVDKIRPRLGRGRADIRCKNPQPVANTNISISKSHKIPKAQNVTKNNMVFLVPDQLITNKTETITRWEIQNENREQPFYPDPIYRPPPGPPENLQLNSPEYKPDNKPKIDVEFEEN